MSYVSSSSQFEQRQVTSPAKVPSDLRSSSKQQHPSSSSSTSPLPSVTQQRASNNVTTKSPVVSSSPLPAGIGLQNNTSSVVSNNLASATHASVGLSYGLSAPHYVTLEEFAQLRRTMERDKEYREDENARLRREVAELRERTRATASFQQSVMQNRVDAGYSGSSGAYDDLSTTALGRGGEGGGASEGGGGGPSIPGVSSTTSVLMSSPPRTTSRLYASRLLSNTADSTTIITGESTTNFTPQQHVRPYPPQQSSSSCSSLGHVSVTQSSIIKRLERLESLQLAMPAQFESIEEKMRSIVEERMRKITQTSQLASLLSEIHNLSKRMDELQTAHSDIGQMLEHDVARNAPIKASIDELTGITQSLVRDVDQLQTSRLTTDDSRVKFENELRHTKTKVGDLEATLDTKLELAVAKLGTSREAIVEAIIDKRMVAEREALKELVRHETRKIHEELNEAQTLLRVEMDAVKQQHHHSHKAGASSSSAARAGRGGAGREQQQNNDNDSGGGGDLSYFEEDPEEFQRQQIQKFRQLESSIISHVGDTTRQLESKLSTRVREISESAQASVAEELSERMDQQMQHVVNTVKEDLHHDVSKHVESLMKRETEKLTRRMAAAASSSAEGFFYDSAAAGGGRSPSSALPPAPPPASAGAGGGGGGHSRTTSSGSFVSASAGAPDIILDGIDLFVRELQVFDKQQQQQQQQQSSAAQVVVGASGYKQCVELIADCRARGKTTAADAMLLMWKFLRGHLQSFGVVCQNVADLRFQLSSLTEDFQNQPIRTVPAANPRDGHDYDNEAAVLDDGGGSSSKRRRRRNNMNHNTSSCSSAEKEQEEDELADNIISDVDMLLGQFAQGGGALGEGFQACVEYAEYCRSRQQQQQQQNGESQQNNGAGVNVGNAVQLVWLFFRGFLSLMHVLGTRIDRLEESSLS